MKHKILLLSLLASVCALVLMSGCVYNDITGEVVLTEKICVNFSEYRESPTLESTVVSEKFRDRLFELLDKYDAELEDIVSIGVVGGSYKVAKPSMSGHDWTITAAVTVKRQDDPMGPVTDGPATLMNTTVQPLYEAKAKPVPADLQAAGVAVINRALEDLKEGGDPRLILTLVGGNITPAPSPSDPLEFSWLACVTFQIVVDVDMYNNKTN